MFYTVLTNDLSSYQLYPHCEVRTYYN